MKHQIKYNLSLALMIALGLLLTATGCSEQSNGSVEAKISKSASKTGESELSEKNGEGVEAVRLSPQGLEEAGIVVEALALRSQTSAMELPGTLLPHPDGEGFVGSLVEGRINEVFADVGDRVADGARLCTIESPTVGEAEAAYITAVADHLFVKADLERHKTLVSEGIGSKKEQLELEARLASSSSAVSATERTLHAYGFTEDDIKTLQTNQHTGGRVTLRSPISGSIISRQARVGMQVSQETDLFHIVDLKRLRVQVDIPEQKIGQLSIGTEVTIVSQNGHRSELKGKIDRIGGSIEHATRTVTAYATVDNSAGKMRPGGFVTVRIEQAGSGVLTVPEDAVFKAGDGDQAIFVESKPGEFALREVETGAKVGGWTLITSGVSAGERVVIKGAFAIKSEFDKSKFGDGHGH